MSRPARLALLLGCSLALLVGAGGWFLWIVPRRSAAVESFDVAGNLAEIDAFLAERAAGAVPKAASLDAPRLVREPIDEDVAVRLFPQLVLSRSAVEYDEHCYYRYRPYKQRVIEFSERPEGSWEFRTNGAGLREDGELSKKKPALRVVVAGDSQTEGVCANRESWPNLLELALGREYPSRAIEVINTGKAGYQFYNYLGVLEKYLEHEPDVFVAGVYGGNDFAESMILHHYFRRTARPSCAQCDTDSMAKVQPERTIAIYTQAFRQIQYFRHHPAERDQALEAALSVVGEIDRVCEERGIVFLLAYLPTVVDVQPASLGAQLDTALAAFGMERADLALTNDLADRLIGFARARGVEVLDYREHFPKSPRPLYWNRDLHLNIAGNYAVSALLVPPIEKRFEARLRN